MKETIKIKSLEEKYSVYSALIHVTTKPKHLGPEMLLFHSWELWGLFSIYKWPRSPDYPTYPLKLFTHNSPPSLLSWGHTRSCSESLQGHLIELSLIFFFFVFPTPAYGKDTILSERQGGAELSCFERNLQNDSAMPTMSLFLNETPWFWFKRRNCNPEIGDGVSRVPSLAGGRGEAISFRFLTFDHLFFTRLPCCPSWHCFILFQSKT